MNQSKTTKNANHYQIEPGSLNIQIKNSAGSGNASTTNNQAVSNLKLKNQKISNTKQEFNCLINNNHVSSTQNND